MYQGCACLHTSSTGLGLPGEINNKNTIFSLAQHPIRNSVQGASQLKTEKSMSQQVQDYKLKKETLNVDFINKQSTTFELNWGLYKHVIYTVII